MKVTTKTLDKIREMNENGCNDSTISQALSLSPQTVAHWRTKMGLPVIYKHRPALLTKYSVYDTYTDEFVVEGTASECADNLGISKSYFFSSITKCRKGMPARYVIQAAK